MKIVTMATWRRLMAAILDHYPAKSIAQIVEIRSATDVRQDGNSSTLVVWPYVGIVLEPRQKFAMMLFSILCRISATIATINAQNIARVALMEFVMHAMQATMWICVLTTASRFVETE